jgi:hypothetical protein
LSEEREREDDGGEGSRQLHGRLRLGCWE